ncbi:N-acetyltransferase [Nocardia sp. NRRL S-836]|uniref:GNAT family N-acetyltransferase n=1 Tax=Nocardia sp. NRRL S-836 TaxID=1519492 RepID=UPI001E58266E|nr:GNAT family N-acetyltransferase [Nocardia sp. NRRL S-836]
METWTPSHVNVRAEAGKPSSAAARMRVATRSWSITSNQQSIWSSPDRSSLLNSVINMAAFPAPPGVFPTIGTGIAAVDTEPGAFAECVDADVEGLCRAAGEPEPRTGIRTSGGSGLADLARRVQCVAQPPQRVGFLGVERTCHCEYPVTTGRSQGATQHLQRCEWSGSALHLTQVARELERAQDGMVDYLAVCPPSDIPVAIGGVDYQVNPGAGTLWQLAVHPSLQSCGIGTLLIQAAEQRILARGLRRAELGVEERNPRARALYERLGYVAHDRKPDAWDAEGPDGVVRRYETVCTVMRRWLA